MTETPLPRSTLIKLVLSRILLAIPVLILILFVPAGTLAYWEAWLYLAILLIPMTFVFTYLLVKDPELLERRMRVRERETTQKRVIGISLVYFLLVFTLPGFDHRFGWSDVPPVVVILADLVVLLGYGLFFLVLKTNSYASRVIEVSAGQQVISSGPYGVVRHPMYLAAILMYVASPLALGSYWAVLPAVMIIPILVVRILNEEKVLERDLPGYPEYEQKVRRRLVPRVW